MTVERTLQPLEGWRMKTVLWQGDGACIWKVAGTLTALAVEAVEPEGID